MSVQRPSARDTGGAGSPQALHCAASRHSSRLCSDGAIADPPLFRAAPLGRRLCRRCPDGALHSAPQARLWRPGTPAPLPRSVLPRARGGLSAQLALWPFGPSVAAAPRANGPRLAEPWRKRRARAVQPRGETACVARSRAFAARRSGICPRHYQQCPCQCQRRRQQRQCQ